MAKWICFFFGHRYVLAQKLSEHSRRMCCPRCRQSFAMNDDARALVDWGPELHRMYERHGVAIKYKGGEYNQAGSL